MAPQLAEADVLVCCACESFAQAIARAGPYADQSALITVARRVWWTETPVSGWLAALAAHPRIGDLETLRSKFGAFADSSRHEQAASGATDEQLQELAERNAQYEQRFGHKFIICASGKPASVMLAALNTRLPRAPADELFTAAGEQMKITELRLQQLASRVGIPPAAREPRQQVAERTGQMRAHLEGQALRSPITTHMLDTALGRPAEGVPVRLLHRYQESEDAWEVVGSGCTNADGRVPDLLPPAAEVAPGMYRLVFEVSKHMENCKALHPGFFPDVPFYPLAQITFNVTPEKCREHFHVPLTWNPYGYSTYRGS